MTPNLNPTQKRYLRGLAHAIKPVVLVGGKGVGEGLVAETAAALAIHELIKVRVAAEDREARDLAIDQLLVATQAALVTRIGHVAVLYRPRAEKPLIALPR